MPFSDSAGIIVSEETGTISVAEEGMLKRHLATQTLQKLLIQKLIGEEKQRGVFSRIKDKTRGKGGSANDSES